MTELPSIMYEWARVFRLHKIVKDLGLGEKEMIKVLELAKYDEKQKVDPRKEKSKLTFVPTLRGIACIWSFYPFNLKLSISRYKLKKEDEITTYLAFVNDVFKFKHQYPMLKDLFANIERDYLNIEKGHATKKG